MTLTKFFLENCTNGFVVQMASSSPNVNSPLGCSPNRRGPISLLGVEDYHNMGGFFIVGKIINFWGRG